MLTRSIRCRWRISSCSLAFWKRACSLSSADVSKYTSTSLVGSGVGGTETQHGGSLESGPAWVCSQATLGGWGALMPAVLGLRASHFLSITAEPRSWLGPSPTREGTYHLLKSPEPGSSGPPTSLHTEGDRLQTHRPPLCLSGFSITHEVLIVFPNHNGHRTGIRVSGSVLEDTTTVSLTGLHHPEMGNRTTVLPLAPSWTGEAEGPISSIDFPQAPM